jgi:hypothetical protein
VRTSRALCILFIIPPVAPFLGWAQTPASTSTPTPTVTPIPGGINLDGFVDAKDRTILQRNWHKGIHSNTGSSITLDLLELRVALDVSH